jgi:signal transduction histidine kinase
LAVIARGANDDETAADIETLRFAENQLASAIGAASSRNVLSILLSGNNVSRSDALRLLDEASAALEYNRDLLQHALDHARQGITVFDDQLRLLCWNREFQELFGLPGNLMRVGTKLEEIVNFNAKKGLYGPGRRDRIVAARLENFKTYSSQSRLRLYPDGKTVELRSAPLPDGGIVTTYTDVTDTVLAEELLAKANESLEARVRERTEELLRLNSALTRAKAEAEDANLSKTKFLAAASHDILQPLNAARLYSTALLERDRQTGDLSLAENVASSLEAVEDILTTLLDISRLDAGAMKPELSAVSLDDIFNQLKIELEPLALEKDLRLSFVKTSLTVRTDRRLLRRLLQNLVSNAIKYTPKGRILVGCRQKKGKVRIEVRDTGLGIPLSQQKTIFREFKRLDEGARVARGLGLGLSIVERIARLLRHPLKLASEQGKGSTFSVEVPISESAPTRPVKSAGSAVQLMPLSGLRIVVVDNEPTIVDGMRIVLEGWGCTVTTASGLEPLLEIETSFDAVIADYHLDHGTGFDVIKNLRGRMGPDLGAILITADRSKAVRDEAEANDVVVLNKPVKPAALRALLAQWQTARHR